MIENDSNRYENKHFRRFEWFNKKGLLHREDGPAVEYIDGGKHWYVNGKRHRLDGPAVENANGGIEYCINGKYFLHDEWLIKTRQIKLKELLNLFLFYFIF